MLVARHWHPRVEQRRLTLHTRSLAAVPVAKVDTLSIAGGEGAVLRAVIRAPAVRRWVRRCAASAARFGSVCTGVFVLAAFDLVDGKRVATHWAACDALALRFPRVAVDSD